MHNCHTEEMSEGDSLRRVQCCYLYTKRLDLVGEREVDREMWMERNKERARGREREREREREKIVYCSSLVEISIFHLAKHTHTAPYYDLSLSLSLSLSLLKPRVIDPK